VRGEGAHCQTQVAGVFHLSGPRVAELIGIGPGVDHRVGEFHGRGRREGGVVVIGPQVERRRPLPHQLILFRVVPGELLGIVLVGHAPGEAVVVPRPQPVQLLGGVAVWSVLRAEELAVGGKGHVEGIAKPVGKEVPGPAQLLLVIGQDDPLPVGGEAEDGRGQGDLPQSGELSLVVLHLSVVGARAGIDIDKAVVGTDHNAVEIVVKGRGADRVGLGAGQGGPGPLTGPGVDHSLDDGGGVSPSALVVVDQVHGPVRPDGESQH